MFIPFFSLLTFFTDAVFQKRLIKNENLPICSNCVYFDCEKSKSEFDTRNAKCLKFGKIDIVSGEYRPYFASLCRDYEELCGKEGKYFIKLNNNSSLPLLNLTDVKNNSSSKLEKNITTGYLHVIQNNVKLIVENVFSVSNISSLISVFIYFTSSFLFYKILSKM